MVCNILGGLSFMYASAIFIATMIEGYKRQISLSLPNTFGYCLIVAAICFK